MADPVRSLEDIETFLSTTLAITPGEPQRIMLDLARHMIQQQGEIETMSVRRTGTLPDHNDDSKLLKMSVAASIASGMLATSAHYAQTKGPVMTTDDALHVFAEVFERMFGDRWEPPKHHE